MKIKTLIVDDEVNNRENLHALLKEYCKDVQVVGLADSVDSAYKIIKSQKPDLVFLDIKMPEKDGFKLLESLNENKF
jgi:two-component system LytT family response regulator